MAHDAIECGREVSSRRCKLRRIFSQDCRHRLRGRIALKRTASREHLEEDGSEGEQVAARINWFTAHLFRRHVADGAEHAARRGVLLERRHAGAHDL
jgi:hypothetical protein